MFTTLNCGVDDKVLVLGGPKEGRRFIIDISDKTRIILNKEQATRLALELNFEKMKEKEGK